MARLDRLCPVNIPQHIIQRGNNRQVCFNGDEAFAAYAHWLKEFANKYHIEIHAWVFMTNHVHLLATPTAPNAISLMMQSLGRQYVRYYNHTYKRTGPLWEGRYKSCIVQTNEYLLKCYRYIELISCPGGNGTHAGRLCVFELRCECTWTRIELKDTAL